MQTRSVKFIRVIVMRGEERGRMRACCPGLGYTLYINTVYGDT